MNFSRLRHVSSFCCCCFVWDVYCLCALWRTVKLTNNNATLIKRLVLSNEILRIFFCVIIALGEKHECSLFRKLKINIFHLIASVTGICRIRAIHIEQHQSLQTDSEQIVSVPICRIKTLHRQQQQQLIYLSITFAVLKPYLEYCRVHVCFGQRNKSEINFLLLPGVIGTVTSITVCCSVCNRE